MTVPLAILGMLTSDIFLDLNQEALIKTDFDLSGKGRAVVEADSRLVTGAAGSGKSLILIHRAKLLAEMDANARILVLTHNRPLNGYLSTRFGNIYQDNVKEVMALTGTGGFMSREELQEMRENGTQRS